MTAMTCTEDNSQYLGRSLEEWLADFLSPEYVDGMEFFRSVLLNSYPEYILLGFRESHALYDWNTNLVCQAMPCFGAAFVQKAVEVLPKVDDRKQARLVFCIANAGRQFAPLVMQYLNHPSAKVRIAACSGFAKIYGDDAEVELPPAIMDRIKGYFQKPHLHREEIVDFFNTLGAWEKSPEGKGLAKANILVALLNKLQDDEQAVKLAAVGALHWVLDPIVSSVLDFKRHHAFNNPDPVFAKHTVNVSARNEIKEYVGSLTKNEVGPLLRAVNDGNPVIRQGATKVTRMLQVIGLADTTVLSSLENEWRANPILAAMDDREPIDVEVFGKNQAELLGKTPAVSLAVQDALAECRQFLTASNETLIGALLNRDIAVRIAAVRALKKLSSPEQDFGFFLLDSLNDPCRQVRIVTQLALNTSIRHRATASMNR